MLLKMKSYIIIIISFFAIFLFTGCYEGDIYLKNKSHNMLVLDLSNLTKKTSKVPEQMFMVDGNRSGTSKKIASNIYEANINNTIFGVWDKNTQTLSLKGLKPNTHYSIQALNSNKLEVETLPLLSGEIYWKTSTGEYLTQSIEQVAVLRNSLNSNPESKSEYIKNFENNQVSKKVDVSLNSNPESKSEYIENFENNQIYLSDANNIPTKINMLYNGSFALFKIKIDETNFKYLGIDDNGILTIIDNNEYNISNQFEYIENFENFENVVLFKSKKTGTYLVKDGNLIKASTTNSGNNENAKFQLDHIKKSTSKIAIKSILSGKYLAYDANNDNHHAIKDQSNGEYEYTLDDFGLFKHILYNGKYLTTHNDNKYFYYVDDNFSDYRLIRFEVEHHKDGTKSLINHYSKKRVSLADDSSTVALGNFNLNPFLLHAANTNSEDDEAEDHEKFNIEKEPTEENISLKVVATGKFYNDRHPSNAPSFKNMILENHGTFVAFKHHSYPGKYLKVIPYFANSYKMEWEGTELNQYTMFTMIEQDDGTVAFKSFYQERYLQGFSVWDDRLTVNDTTLDNKAKFLVLKTPKKQTISLESKSNYFVKFHSSDKKFYLESRTPLYNILVEDYGFFVTLKSLDNGKYIKTADGVGNSHFELMATENNFINDNTHYRIEHLADGSKAILSLFTAKYVNGWSDKDGVIRLATTAFNMVDSSKFLFLTKPTEENISLKVVATGKFYNDRHPSNAPSFKNMILENHGTFVAFKHHSYPGKYLKVIPYFANSYKMEWEGTELNQYTMFTMIEQDDGTVAFKSFYQERYLQGFSVWDDRLTVNDTTLDNKAKFLVLKTPKKQTISLESDYLIEPNYFVKFRSSDKKFYLESRTPLYNILVEDYGFFVTLKSLDNGKYIKTADGATENNFININELMATENNFININTHYKIEHLADGSKAIISLFNNKFVGGFGHSKVMTDYVIRLATTTFNMADSLKFRFLAKPKELTEENISLKVVATGKFYNDRHPSNAPSFKNMILENYGTFVAFKHHSYPGKYLKVIPYFANSYKMEWEGTELNQYTMFTMIEQDDGTVAFKSFYQERYLQGFSVWDDRLTVNDTTLDNKAKFWIISADSSYTRHATDTLTQNIVNYLRGKKLSDIKSVIVRDKDHNRVTGRYNASTGKITLNDDDEFLYIKVVTKNNEIFKIKLHRSFGYPLASFKIKNSYDVNCKQIEKSGSSYNLVNKSCSDSDDWYYGYSGWIYQKVGDELVCASQNGENLSDATFAECNYEDVNEIFSINRQWIIDPKGNDDFIVKSKTHFDYNTTYDDPYTFVNLEQFAGSLKANNKLSDLITYDTHEGREGEIEVTKVSPIDFWSNSASIFRLKDQTNSWKLDISYFPFNHEFQSLDFIIPFTIADYHTKATANENINAEFNVAEYFKVKAYRTEDNHSNKVLRIEARIDCSIVERPEYCVEDDESKELIVSTDILESNQHYLHEFGLLMIRYNKNNNSLSLNLGTKNYQDDTLTKDNKLLVISRATIGDEGFYKLIHSMRLIGASQTQTNVSNVDLLFHNSIMDANPEKPVQSKHSRHKRSFLTWFGTALFVVGAVLIVVATGGAAAPFVLGVLAVGAASSLIIGDVVMEKSMNTKLPAIQNNPVITQQANIKTFLTPKDKALLYSIDDDFSILIDQLDTSSANFNDKGSISFSSNGIVEANINSFISKNIQIVCSINPDLSTSIYKCSSSQDVDSWNIQAQNISNQTTSGKNLFFNTIGNVDPEGIIIQAKYTHNSKDYFIKYRVHLANDLNSLNKDVSLLSTNSSYMHSISLSRGERQFENFEIALNDLNILHLTQEHSDYSITKEGVACLPLLDKTYLGYKLIDPRGHNYICSALGDQVTNLRLAKNSPSILNTKDSHGKYILLTVDSSNIEHIFINADISIDDKNYTITQRVGKESDLEDNSRMKNFYKYRIASNGFNDISSLIDVDLSFTGDYYWDKSTPKPRVPFECYEDLTSNKLVCKGESSVSGKTLVLKNGATQVDSHIIGTDLISFNIPNGVLLSKLVISVQDGNTVQYSSSADAFMNTVKATVIKEDANNNPSSIYVFYRDTEDKEDDSTDKILFTNSELGLFHIREMDSSKQISFHDAIGCVPNRKDLYIPNLTEDSNGNMSPNLTKDSNGNIPSSNLFVYKNGYNTLCLIFGDNGSSGFSDFSLKTKGNISHETSLNGKMIWINREKDDDIFLTAKVTRGTSTYKVTLKPRHVEANASVELDDFYNAKSEREQGLLYVPSLMSVAMFPTGKRVPGTNQSVEDIITQKYGINKDISHFSMKRDLKDSLINEFMSSLSFLLNTSYYWQVLENTYYSEQLSLALKKGELNEPINAIKDNFCFLPQSFTSIDKVKALTNEYFHVLDAGFPELLTPAQWRSKLEEVDIVTDIKDSDEKIAKEFIANLQKLENNETFASEVFDHMLGNYVTLASGKSKTDFFKELIANLTVNSKKAYKFDYYKFNGRESAFVSTSNDSIIMMSDAVLKNDYLKTIAYAEEYGHLLVSRLNTTLTTVQMVKSGGIPGDEGARFKDIMLGKYLFYVNYIKIDKHSNRYYPAYAFEDGYKFVVNGIEISIEGRSLAPEISSGMAGALFNSTDPISRAMTKVTGNPTKQTYTTTYTSEGVTSVDDTNTTSTTYVSKGMSTITSTNIKKTIKNVTDSKVENDYTFGSTAVEATTDGNVSRVYTTREWNFPFSFTLQWPAILSKNLKVADIVKERVNNKCFSALSKIHNSLFKIIKPRFGVALKVGWSGKSYAVRDAEGKTIKDDSTGDGQYFNGQYFKSEPWAFEIGMHNEVLAVYHDASIRNLFGLIDVTQGEHKGKFTRFKLHQNMITRRYVKFIIKAKDDIVIKSGKYHSIRGMLLSYNIPAGHISKQLVSASNDTNKFHSFRNGFRNTFPRFVGILEIVKIFIPELVLSYQFGPSYSPGGIMAYQLLDFATQTVSSSILSHYIYNGYESYLREGRYQRKYMDAYDETEGESIPIRCTSLRQEVASIEMPQIPEPLVSGTPVTFTQGSKAQDIFNFFLDGVLTDLGSSITSAGVAGFHFFGGENWIMNKGIVPGADIGFRLGLAAQHMASPMPCNAKIFSSYQWNVQSLPRIGAFYNLSNRSIDWADRIKRSKQ